MSGGGSRVSIPNSVRKTIENIKEITGNHSDDEIYAMLKECSMDPNETTQKLLLQDTFHEVKSKRERRKENANNRESVESRWKTGVQGRGSRGGRINSSPRYISHDAGGGRNSGSGKENGVNQVIEKGVSLPMPTSQEMKNKEKIPVTSSVPVENCATIVASGGVPEITSLADISGKGSSLPPVNANKNPTRAFGTRNSSEQPAPKSDNSAVSITLASSSSALSSSSSDPSNESQLLGAADASKCDGGASLHSNEPSTVNHVENKLILEAMEISDSLAQENQPIKPHKIEESQPNEISPPSVSTHGGSLVNQPNYNKRPQQVIGPHKASSNKEWKPKTTSSVVIQQSRAIGAAAASEVPVVTFEATDLSQPATRVLDSEEATLKLQKKLEELHISKSQLVIIPNHIQVPESERSKLSFGSFGSFATSFGVSATVLGGPESDQRPTPPSETSVDVDESLEEETSSYPNALGTTEDVDSPERSQSPTHMPENLSPGGDLSSGTIHEYNDLKQESGFPSGGHTNSVQTSSGYSFGFISPVVGSQISAVENSDSQGRDASRLPGFVVQPPFDPSSYYAQFYRSGDNDGRLSPFLSPGVAAKYNGNVALLPPTSSQSPQEGVVTAGPTALLTQAAGLMQSSIAVTQQPVPVFRPPAGVHISHYPPNYIPYGHYFSPFYVPPPPIHQFVGNNAFPQQPQGGNVYQAPPPAATAAVKYSIPQYKMGANSGNSSHIGMPSGYGPYGSSASGFSPSTAAQTGNTTTNEELGASQFKENSVYITGPQSDGSAVWIGAPGRDMSSLPANAFYNLPPQGQHLTFTPTQTGHGTFASIYHPAQAVNAANVHPLLQQSQAVAAGVDTVGPGGNIYQQPQHSQINWPNNY